MFCFLESKDLITASKEHLLSQPVADAFGIDRTAPVARVNTDMTVLKWAQLNGIQRKCVCIDCNNGWMNRLEHRMKPVAQWLVGEESAPLGLGRALDLRKWAIKTHMLLCFLDGNAGHFGDDSFPGEAVVPPFTPGRQLYEGDMNALLDAAVGVSRSAASTDFAWSFGLPTVKATGSGQGHARFAPASVLTLGALQLWVVVPLLDAAATAPTGVVSCGPGVRPSDLIELGHPLTLEGMVVDFG